MAMSDLPSDMVEEVLSRVTLKSLRAVRTTCKNWNTLSKRLSFTKKNEFLTIMMKDFRAYITSVSLRGIHKDDDEGNVELSIDRKGKLISVNDADQVDISSVFHCSGLLLCTTKEENLRLVVLNPYRGQPRWIEPTDHRSWPMKRHMYALGYEKKKKNSPSSHKTLRIRELIWRYLDNGGVRETRLYGFQIYNFNSDSWKEVHCHTSGWNISYYNSGVSLKGNTYWFAWKGDNGMDMYYRRPARVIPDFCLLCFDFTTERLGPPLPLPFKPSSLSNVTLSCVRDKQLAVLYKRPDILQMEIWITTKIKPETVSWSMFLTVDMKPPTYCQFPFQHDESFFVDEEKKVVVIFDKAKGGFEFDPSLNVVYIIGNDGNFKRVNLGEDTDTNGCKLVCSYVPSSVQINHD